MDWLRNVGCRQYTVGHASDDYDTIWTREVWDTKEQHDASLELPDTRVAICQGDADAHGRAHEGETTVIGGLNL